jgi:hypothetical protein
MDLMGPQKPEVRYLETEIILLRQRVSDLVRRVEEIEAQLAEGA